MEEKYSEAKKESDDAVENAAMAEHELRAARKTYQQAVVRLKRAVGNLALIECSQRSQGPATEDGEQA